MKRLFTRLFNNYAALFGVFVVLLVIITAIFAPLLAPNDPTQQNLVNALKPPFFSSGGSFKHVLGTDPMGRDILSRIIFGSRISLAISGLAVGMAMLVGVPLGISAGFYGKWTDTIISRLIEIQLSVPYILLAVTIVMVAGPSLAAVVGVLALRGWVMYARIVRGEVLSLKNAEYITSARAFAAPSWRIFLFHIIPNITSILIVIATLQMANFIIFAAGLSFLGLGVPPPVPSWGRMLADGRNYVASAWWIATFPGLAITFTALGLNLLGDGVRELLDPRTRLDLE